MVVLHKAKVFDPIKNGLLLPEVSDASKRWRGKHTYGDAERAQIFTFTKSPDYGSIGHQHKLVEPNRIQILLGLPATEVESQNHRAGSARWRPGFPRRCVFCITIPISGPKFVRQLYSGMDATLYRDNRLAIDWLGSGKYSISFFVQKLEEAEIKGVPVLQFKQTMKEGVGLSSRVGQMALLNRTPHPNAAKVFINWYLSREGQELFQKLQIAAHDPADSLRIDITKNQIPTSRPPAGRRQKYIASRRAESFRSQPGNSIDQGHPRRDREVKNIGNIMNERLDIRKVNYRRTTATFLLQCT